MDTAVCRCVACDRHKGAQIADLTSAKHQFLSNHRRNGLIHRQNEAVEAARQLRMAGAERRQGLYDAANPATPRASLQRAASMGSTSRGFYQTRVVGGY